jgi:predicted pyridoxine 5'-phosphate oxidase superfamily flavin-nucleotide-binding protein
LQIADPATAVARVAPPGNRDRLCDDRGVSESDPFAGALERVADLRAHYDAAMERAVRKDIARLDEMCRRLIAASPMLFVATFCEDGRCDVSPRGGPPGFVSVLDDHHLAIPDATGNRRLDTLENVVATGRAALIFLIPGRDTTLRVNGGAPRQRPAGAARPPEAGREAAPDRHRRAGRGGVRALRQVIRAREALGPSHLGRPCRPAVAGGGQRGPRPPPGLDRGAGGAAAARLAAPSARVTCIRGRS